ncbi:nuclear transport factor 2 family protein [Luteimonas sp. FCS-9]|uniref:nuclear transport factor 2 family protein n=1 Tax=Luteimonas sp. FCS-9 TaxID=1547516 RepID=UPI00063EB7C5|nr:nuclear transport factor 2 family protein [Luteimonas sp. FCS-9]KLI98487.1 hypothetical protein WQ56_14940 [Luteimonas sp. FCS-9]
MDLACCAAICVLLIASAAAAARTPDAERAVRAADDAFWTAYNACDMAAISALLTEDVEFYHDRTGRTTSRADVVDSLREGPCATPDMRLRREVIDHTTAFHPLADGYAILSARHRFHVRIGDAPEQLDGQAEFTTLWQLHEGRWRMHRILSYAHGPVPYTPPQPIRLSAAALAACAGRYHAARIGRIVVAVDGDHLRLTAGEFVVMLYPESTHRFFAKERDLRFEFETGGGTAPNALVVYENGVVTERAVRD